MLDILDNYMGYNGMGRNYMGHNDMVYQKRTVDYHLTVQTHPKMVDDYDVSDFWDSVKNHNPG